MKIDASYVILWDFEFFEKWGRLNLSYCPKNTHKYKISIKELWYWICPKSIQAFKFFKIYFED